MQDPRRFQLRTLSDDDDEDCSAGEVIVEATAACTSNTSIQQQAFQQPPSCTSVYINSNNNNQQQQQQQFGSLVSSGMTKPAPMLNEQHNDYKEKPAYLQYSTSPLGLPQQFPVLGADYVPQHEPMLSSPDDSGCYEDIYFEADVQQQQQQQHAPGNYEWPPVYNANQDNNPQFHYQQQQQQPAEVINQQTMMPSMITNVESCTTVTTSRFFPLFSASPPPVQRIFFPFAKFFTQNKTFDAATVGTFINSISTSHTAPTPPPPPPPPAAPAAPMYTPESFLCTAPTATDQQSTNAQQQQQWTYQFINDPYTNTSSTTTTNFMAMK